MNRNAILVTGANGYIGKKLVAHLRASGSVVKTISRYDSDLNYNAFKNDNFSKDFFSDISTVIHLASVAHQFKHISEDLVSEVNVDYAKKLQAVCEQTNIPRFIFISSIAVTLLEEQKGPTSIYAKTKKEVEDFLREKRLHTQALWILRPPMVYGKNAPGNFAKLIKLFSYPIILPLGSFTSRKTFIHIDNLVSAIETVLKKPASPGSWKYEISDPWETTTSEYFDRIIKNNKLKAKLTQLPVSVRKITQHLQILRKYFDKFDTQQVCNYQAFVKDLFWKEAVSKEQAYKNLI